MKSPLWLLFVLSFTSLSRSTGREMEHLRWSSSFGACVIKMNELTTNKVTISYPYLYSILSLIHLLRYVQSTSTACVGPGPPVLLIYLLRRQSNIGNLLSTVRNTPDGNHPIVSKPQMQLLVLPRMEPCLVK
ncbi:hypothetical protein GGI42DRAFT_46498 [Trichoderma sp. SZMC 28013]